MHPCPMHPRCMARPRAVLAACRGSTNAPGPSQTGQATRETAACGSGQSTMRIRSSNSFCCFADRPPGAPPPPLLDEAPSIMAADIPRACLSLSFAQHSACKTAAIRPLEMVHRAATATSTRVTLGQMQNSRHGPHQVIAASVVTEN